MRASGEPQGRAVSRDRPDAYVPIDDYAVVGDCRTLALVSRAGSIDWWCPPRFDAPSLFGRVLDAERGGSCTVEAAGLHPVGRRYLSDSAVLESRFECHGGALTVTDFMALSPLPRESRPPEPYARQKLVRVMRCERGAVDVRFVVAPRPGYGLHTNDELETSDAGPRTLVTEAACRVAFRATHPWSLIDQGTAGVPARLAAGDELGLVVDYGHGDRRGEGIEHPGAESGIDGCELDELRGWRDETVSFWQGWVAAGRYPERNRDLVQRSAITLKLLTYHPTGAIVAAGTTSLPEEIGGQRNWDYRFTWLRDATFTLYALHTIGYGVESNEFMNWLRQTLADEAFEPLVLYRVDGLPGGTERTLDDLEGYRGSRPVRIGNGATWQRQLDIYGEVLDAAYLDLRAGNEVSEHDWHILARMADLARHRWRRPDTSIWEVRGGRRHFVYSKVMCWVALDRARRIAELTGRATDERARISAWEREAREIRRTVFERGRRADGAFAQSFGSARVDASALLFPLIGFVRAGSPAAEATLRAVVDELEDERGFVMRYRPDEAVEGVAGGEGAFLICSFWLCDNLAIHGDVAGARERFERLSACANDLGLLSEEWDAMQERALGNFPQAFTHIALISSAYNLERAEAGRMQGKVRGSAPPDEDVPPTKLEAGR